MMTLSQIMVFLLMADAAWVAIGLMQKQNMWFWITIYWVLLTLKNGFDFAGIGGWKWGR